MESENRLFIQEEIKKQQKSVNEIAKEVIAGKWGNGI